MKPSPEPVPRAPRNALPGRLELPTLRLTASRSNQLSYGSLAAQVAPVTGGFAQSPRNKRAQRSTQISRRRRGCEGDTGRQREGVRGCGSRLVGGHGWVRGFVQSSARCLMDILNSASKSAKTAMAALHFRLLCRHRSRLAIARASPVLGRDHIGRAVFGPERTWTSTGLDADCASIGFDL